MKLEIWINAFIPEVIGNYTQRLKEGPYKNKTAVPLPDLANWTTNLAKPFHTGYLTDQRSFSTHNFASSRMHSEAAMDIDCPTAGFTQQHTSSGTTEVNLLTGVKQGFRVADMNGCNFSAPVDISPLVKPTSIPGFSTLSDNSTVTSIKVSGSGTDPLVFFAAPIKYEGRFIVRTTVKIGSANRNVSVYFDGYISDFPAFEAYASYNSNTKTLFKLSPPAGNTVLNLTGNFNPFTGPPRKVLSSTVFF